MEFLICAQLDQILLALGELGTDTPDLAIVGAHVDLSAALGAVTQPRGSAAQIAQTWRDQIFEFVTEA